MGADGRNLQYVKLTVNFRLGDAEEIFGADGQPGTLGKKYASRLPKTTAATTATAVVTPDQISFNQIFVWVHFAQ